MSRWTIPIIVFGGVGAVLLMPLVIFLFAVLMDSLSR
jgi:hypothetical protein